MPDAAYVGRPYGRPDLSDIQRFRDPEQVRDCLVQVEPAPSGNHQIRAGDVEAIVLDAAASGLKPPVQPSDLCQQDHEPDGIAPG